MKKLVLLMLLAFSLVFLPIADATAQAPQTINYQGKLVDDGGNAIPSGTKSVVFEIYEDEAGGSALWLEVKNVNVSVDGYFSTYLGEDNPLDLDFNQELWLQVTVGNNDPSPRTKLTSTPSSFYSAHADSANVAAEAHIAHDLSPEVVNWSHFEIDATVAGGDLEGNYPNPSLRANAVLDNIEDGSITQDKLAPNVSTSPSGPAGGDLSGTYPDPLIAVGAVKTDRIADGAITTVKIADGVITDPKLVEMDAAKLFNLAALNNQITVATDATIDGDGTDSDPLGLADSAVTSVKIADGEVMNVDLAPDAVTTDKILDGTILTEDLADDAVTNAKLADNSVMTNNIVNGTIITEDLADDAVTNDKLADDAVRVNNIDVNGGAPADGEVLTWDAVDGEMRWLEETVETDATIDGDGSSAAPLGVADGAISTVKLADDAVTNAKLADNSVRTENIVDGQVMTADLADNSVTTAKILDGEVMTADLADGAVTNVKLADNAVSTVKIQDLAVTNAKINDDAVTTSKLADDAVTSAKILDGTVTSLDMANTGVTPGIYGDPSPNADEIDVPEITVDAAGRITAAVENRYTVISGSTSFDEAAVSDITVDGPYNNLDLQIKPGVVGNAELADNSVSTAKIQDLAVTNAKINDNAVSTVKLQDGAVTSAKIADGDVQNVDLAANSVTSDKILDSEVKTADIDNLAVTTPKINDQAVTVAKVGSGAQVSGRVMKSDGSGGAFWGDDLGMTLPFTGSYDGPGDAFTITHTGNAGDGSAAVFNSNTANNNDPAVEIVKDVNTGAGSALQVYGIGVQGTNYIATFANDNLNEGRTVMIRNRAPAQNITDPNNAVVGDEFVTPDPGDVEDAALVVSNTHGDPSNEKLAIKTYGSIQANSTIQGTNLVAYDGQLTLHNSTIPATAVIEAPSSANGPLNITPAMDLNGSSTVNGLNNIWESGDGILTPAGTGTDNDVPTALAVSNSIGAVADEPFLTFQNHNGTLTNNRVFSTNNTLNIDQPGLTPDGTYQASINLANPNTWTGTQTFSAVGDGIVVTTNANFQGDIYNSTANPVNVNDNLVVTGTSNLQGNVDADNDLNVDGNTTLNGNVDLGDAAADLITFNGEVDSHIIPNGNATYDLGSDAQRWRDVYIDGASLHIGDANGVGSNEVLFGYNAGTAHLDVDAVANVATFTSSQVTFNQNVDATQGLDVTGANFTAGTTTIDPSNGNTSVGGTFTATGTSDLQGSISNSTANNSGNVHVNDDFEVTGTSTLTGNVSAGNDVTVGNDLTVQGDGQFDNDLNLDGILSGSAAGHSLGTALTDANVLTIEGANGGVNTELQVNGDADVTGDLSAGSLTLFGDLDMDDNNILNVDRITGHSVNNVLTLDDNVDITGVLDAQSAGNTIGNNADGTQLTIEGVNGGADELVVTGDVNVSGNSTLATVDINGGTIDNTVIGATNPVAGTFTNLEATTDITLPVTSGGSAAFDEVHQEGDGALQTGAPHDNHLVSEAAVANALAGVDLQFAYDNGNQIITSAGNPIDFDLTNAGFEINTTGSGDVTIDGAGILDVQTNIQNTSLGNAVTVDDDLDVTQALDVDGATTLNGDVTLGDANTDNIVFSGEVNSHIIPNIDDDYDLGSSTQRWRDVYVGPASLHVGIDGNEATVGYTTGTNTLTLTSANTSVTGNLDVAGTFDATTTNGHTIGDGTNATQLTIDGQVGGVNNDLQVNGDANITGSLTTAGLSLTGNLDMQENDIINIDDLDGGAGLTINNTNNGTIATGTGQITLNGNVDATAGLDVTGANFDVNGNFTVTPAGVVTQSGGQVTFGGNVDATNGLDVTNAPLSVGAGGNGMQISHTDGAITVQGTGGITMSGGGGVTLPGAGGLTLSGSGGITVSGTGNVSVTGTGTFSMGGGNVDLDNGAVNIDGNISSAAGDVSVTDNFSASGFYRGTVSTIGAVANLANVSTTLVEYTDGLNSVLTSANFPNEASGTIIIFINNTGGAVTINGNSVADLSSTTLISLGGGTWVSGVE